MSEHYEDIDGNPISLHKLCRLEPDWAESRIRVLIEQVNELRKGYDTVNGACNQHKEELDLLKSDEVKGMATTLVQKENEELRAALNEAINTIRIFHGPQQWNIYYNNVPEIKRMRKLLKEAGGIAKDLHEQYKGMVKP